MQNVVPIAWLAAKLASDGDKPVIVDCRFDLADPAAGKAAYDDGHIPGAVYMHLERDLSGPVGEHGGRHPLPAADSLARLFGQAGIGNDTVVVAYDDQGGAFASRLWWMLKYVGHDAVAVLEQGFSAWKRAGYPVTRDVEPHPAKAFAANVRPDMLLSMREVKERLHRDDVVLLDSRDGARYRGEAEPIDPVAGHIPGAKNAFWKEGLRPDGSWKTPAEQQARFGAIAPDKEVVVYCGSGVTACPNVIALIDAGFRNVKLYGGSWSDWCSYKDNPIATGEE
ncbi:MAG TPA: sulfurtransferase [Bacilli bacterium]